MQTAGWIFTSAIRVRKPETRRNQLFVNQKDGTFKEAADYGLDPSNSIQALFLIMTLMGIWTCTC